MAPYPVLRTDAGGANPVIFPSAARASLSVGGQRSDVAHRLKRCGGVVSYRGYLFSYAAGAPAAEPTACEPGPSQLAACEAGPSQPAACEAAVG